jgi:hypothetical protein
MPKITYLKEFEGKLWARLELDNPTTENVHVLLDSEIAEIRRKERQKCWEEIKRSTCYEGDYD